MFDGHGVAMAGKWLLVGLLAVVVGCSSTTLIDSRPSGAELTVDEEYYVGETPVEVRELPWLWTERRYQFERPGYHVEYRDLSASFDGRHMFMCLCLPGAWPAFFFGRFPERMLVHLDRKAEASKAEFSRQPEVKFGPQ